MELLTHHGAVLLQQRRVSSGEADEDIDNTSEVLRAVDAVNTAHCFRRSAHVLWRCLARALLPVYAGRTHIFSVDGLGSKPSAPTKVPGF